MIDDKIAEALNVQVNEELASAYLYLAMSADFKSKNLDGFASWMQVQTQEEIVHAMKIYDFINSREGKVSLKALKAPQGQWSSPLDAFKAAYEHEQYITGCINKLVKLARDQNDNATELFLGWFVTEQVEEEETASGIVQKLEMIKGSTSGLFMLDAKMGARVFTPPSSGGNG
jgi:ferritin